MVDRLTEALGKDPSALTRRRFIGGCVLGAMVPAAACSAAPPPARFTPEAFGAVGNGVQDDFDAFDRMVKAVNAARGGSIALTPGRNYFLGRFVTAANGVTQFSFMNCDGLAIEGNGATISVKGDFHRANKLDRGLSGLRIADCRNVAIRNLELVGHVDRMTREPTLNETPTHGLLFAGCSEVLVEGVTARHFAGDGLYIREGSRPGQNGAYAASRAFRVRNSRFLFNARQGLSIIQLRGGRFENCDFSYSGYVTPEVRGSYGSHAPGAGVDIEPNRTPSTSRRVDVLTGDIEFQNCRMIGNRGTSFVAWKFGKRVGRILENVTLRSCHLKCDESGPSRYGFIFDVPGGEVIDCKLEMGGRTAYVGWARISDASPRFLKNAVHGRHPHPGRPLLVVRATRGGPVIEGNRLIISEAQALSAANRPSILVVENPNAIVRDNQILSAT
jgi:hypothetical protein